MAIHISGSQINKALLRVIGAAKRVALSCVDLDQIPAFESNCKADIAAADLRVG